MGIDDALRKAHDAEEQRFQDEHAEAVLFARQQLVREELYRDFVARLQDAGVEPLVIYAYRRRPFLLRWLGHGTDVDTGRQAWVIDAPIFSEGLYYAITEEGVEILVRHGRYKDALALKTAPMKPRYPDVELSLEDVDERLLDPEERQGVVEETSERLAAALISLGAA